GRARGEQDGRADRARRAPRVKYLQTERPLDLVPDDDAQVDAHGDEDDEHDPEPELGAFRLASLLAMHAATGSMELVRALDSSRIELQRFVDQFRAASRLGHAREHKRAGRPPDAMSNTFRGGMDDITDHALDTLAAAGLRAAGRHGLDEALQDVADAVVEVTGADAAAIRVVDNDLRLSVRAVATASEALAAELAGSSFALDELPAQPASSDGLPDAVRRAARRARAAD